MGFFDDLFGRGKSNPAHAAQPYLDQIPGVTHGAYDPYINRGNAAGDILGEKYGQMSQDPMAFINAIMNGYKPSEGYQFKKDELGRAASNTAAAGGIRGTNQDQVNQEKIVNGLLGEDMQQWLQNVLGVNNVGLQGENNLYNTGFGASGALAGDLSNTLGTQGQLAFQGQSQKNQSLADILGSILKGGTALGTAPMTGGGSIFGNVASKWM